MSNITEYEGSRADSREEFDTLPPPVTTRKLSRFLLTPVVSRAFETRVGREETLLSVILALQRTIVGKNVSTGVAALVSPPLRETGKTIKGSRGALYDNAL